MTAEYSGRIVAAKNNMTKDLIRHRMMKPTTTALMSLSTAKQPRPRAIQTTFKGRQQGHRIKGL
jgi:hypothetical protein